MIIGLTGPYCSGKDTVAEYLVREKGFVHYSLSDALRDELKARGIPAVRENLITVGTELRRAEGNAVLARRVLAHCAPGREYVITSIRHPAEIEELSRHPGFHLVKIDAPVPLRFERMRRRKREGDPETLEKLLELERRESCTSGPGQQLTECGRRADTVIANDGSIEDLYGKVDRLLEELSRR